MDYTFSTNLCSIRIDKEQVILYVPLFEPLSTSLQEADYCRLQTWLPVWPAGLRVWAEGRRRKTFPGWLLYYYSSYGAAALKHVSPTHGRSFPLLLAAGYSPLLLKILHPSHNSVSSSPVAPIVTGKLEDYHPGSRHWGPDKGDTQKGKMGIDAS